MAYLMDRRLYEPMYEDADVYDRYSLLSPYTQPYADAGMQVPQVQAAPTAPQVSQPLFYNPNSIPGDNYVETYQSPNDPSLAWNDQMRQTAALIERLAAGEQIEGWRYDPGGSWYIPGDSELTGSNPAGAWYNGNFYFAGSGAQQQNDSLSDIFKDVAKLAAIMGTAYLGGTALAGAGGGTAAGTAGLSAADAAYALGMGETAVGGALAPTAAGGSALANMGSVTQLGTPFAELGAVGLPAAEIGLPSLLAPEVIASTVAPEVAGSGLLAPEAAQVINITGTLPSPATPWWAPVATAAPALPIINSLTSPSAPAPSDAPYSNEGRTPSEPRGNMGGEGTPEVPTVNVDPSPWDQFKAWATANPEMARMAFSAAGGLLSASGGSSGGSSGGYRDSGYRPTVSRGGWQPSVTQRTMPTTPLSLNLPTTGQPNSGLWRFAGDRAAQGGLGLLATPMQNFSGSLLSAAAPRMGQSPAVGTPQSGGTYDPNPTGPVPTNVPPMEVGYNDPVVNSGPTIPPQMQELLKRSGLMAGLNPQPTSGWF